MKSHRPKSNQFSKIINQIDCLKKQVYSLMNNLQDRTGKFQRTVIGASKRQVNQHTSNKNLNFKQLVPNKRKVNKQNSYNEHSPHNKICQIAKIKQRVAKMEKSNKKMKKSTIILQNQLILQKTKRQLLQRKVLRDQTSVAIQTSLQGSKSYRLFTPAQKNSKEQLREKWVCSNTRDQQDDSLLLGNLNQLSYSSPKLGKQKFYKFNVIDSTNEIGNKKNESERQLPTFTRRLFENQ